MHSQGCRLPPPPSHTHAHGPFNRLVRMRGLNRRTRHPCSPLPLPQAPIFFNIPVTPAPPITLSQPFPTLSIVPAIFALPLFDLFNQVVSHGGILPFAVVEAPVCFWIFSTGMCHVPQVVASRVVIGMKTITLLIPAPLEPADALRAFFLNTDQPRWGAGAWAVRCRSAGGSWGTVPSGTCSTASPSVTGRTAGGGQ